MWSIIYYFYADDELNFQFICLNAWESSWLMVSCLPLLYYDEVDIFAYDASHFCFTKTNPLAYVNWGFLSTMPLTSFFDICIFSNYIIHHLSHILIDPFIDLHLNFDFHIFSLDVYPCICLVTDLNLYFSVSAFCFWNVLACSASYTILETSFWEILFLLSVASVKTNHIFKWWPIKYFLA